MTYPFGPDGYLRFPTTAGGAEDAGGRLDGYVARQEAGGERFTRDFLLPYLENMGVGPGSGPDGAPGRVLDAGCGAGEAVAGIVAEGVEAVGVDLPKAAAHWASLGRDRERFVCGDVTDLPFADDVFDVVTAFGVIEHVGTLVGHLTLAPDAEERRIAFARELIRVAAPGGRIVLSCPNRAFPLDLHHGPTDAASPNRPVRSAIARRTGISVHAPWGRQALVSFGDVAALFAGPGRKIRALPATGYFAFTSVPAPLRRVVGTYFERLPGRLRSTAVNPFVIAEISVGAADAG